MQDLSPIAKVADVAGGLTAVAAICGVSVPTVYEWKIGRRPVPVRFCLALEDASAGRVSRKDLRPNDWQAIWPELAPALASTAQPATETVATR